LTDIVIVASNSIIRHPRIWKVVSSLKKAYDVLVIGWNREGISSPEVNNYIGRLALFCLRAPFGRAYLVIYYPFFWGWILLKLIKYRPRVVHAIDLDTLVPCSLYKSLFRKKLVYDVHDRFGGYVPQKYTSIFRAINKVEELLAQNADLLVTVSEKVQGTFGLRPEHCAIIMNCSEDIHYNKPKSDDNTLTLVYTGLICKDQGLEIVTAALRELKGVRLLLAGRPADNELLDRITKLPSVKYLGLLQRKESLELEASSDAMVVLYDLQYRKNQLSSPNKIFEAMMCGVPLITNMEANLVSEIDCGIAVDYDTGQVRDAIIKLRDDPQLRTRLGSNGRKAYLEKYNWANMEKKLYQIYDNLLTR